MNKTTDAWKIYYTKPCAVCNKIKVKRDRDEAHRRKFCSKECFYIGRELKGTFQPGHADLVPAASRGHSDTTRQKISDTQRANPRRGSDHPNWRGGAGRTERKVAMQTWEYKEWRLEVFKRDNYTCQECGAVDKYLHAAHIVSWAEDVSLRLDIGNGRALCVRCHYIETFGRDDPEAAIRWGIPAKYRKVVV